MSLNTTPNTKAELIKGLTANCDPSDYYAIGMWLVLISCAKAHNTLQDSIDHYRRLHSQAKFDENMLRHHWDQMRQWS
jgi:hypothetical protein